MFDDLPPDLPRLRTLETWLAMTLDRVRQQITAVERREAERQRGEQARPATPDWLIEYGLNRDAVPNAVHVGGCRMAGKRSRPTDSETVRRAIAGGVPACSFCRPDTELGILDG
ncbi:DUF6233 domain-containing protein [Streptomyces sp. NPDC029006]|uniref:DUF6233 domain-containing protein n=1 Tax=Streptomyces sp. NPDC029006 TaxID=3155467 RepID=UPI0033EDB80F